MTKSYNFLWNEKTVTSFETQSGTFQKQKELGKGVFGTVYEYENKETKENMVIKTIHRGDQPLDSFKEKLLTEMEFIQKVFGFAECQLTSDGNTAAIIMPKLNGISLKNYLSRLNLDEEKDQQKLIQVFYQVLLSVKKLHINHKIVHGDLSINNILIDGDKTNLCDLGTAHKIGAKISNRPYLSFAPETIEKETEADPKQDVYSLGHLLAEYISPKNNLYLIMLSALMRISDPKERASLKDSIEGIKLYISDPSEKRKEITNLMLKVNDSIAPEEKDDQTFDEVRKNLAFIFIIYVRLNKIEHIRSLIQMLPGKVLKSTLEYGHDTFNNNCLHYAAYLGLNEILTDLLDLSLSPSLLNRGNQENNRPAFLALEENHLSTLKLLLETQQIDLSLKGSNELTLIEQATKNGQTEALKLIQDFQAKMEEDRLSLLEKNKKDALALVKEWETSEEKQNTPRMFALKHLETFIKESKNSEDLNKEINEFSKLDEYIQTNKLLKEGNYAEAYMNYTKDYPTDKILTWLENPTLAPTSLLKNSLFSKTAESVDELKPSARTRNEDTPLSPVELR